MSLKAVQDLPQPKFSVEFFQRNFQLALFGSFARFGYDQCPNGYKDIKKELNRHKEKITWSVAINVTLKFDVQNN